MSQHKFGHESIMTFGKYRGESVGDVLIENPNYILWCENNIDFFELDDDASETLRINLVVI